MILELVRLTMKVNCHIESHGIAQADLKLAILLLAGITVLPLVKMDHLSFSIALPSLS